MYLIEESIRKEENSSDIRKNRREEGFNNSRNNSAIVASRETIKIVSSTFAKIKIPTTREEFHFENDEETICIKNI